MITVKRININGVNLRVKIDFSGVERLHTKISSLWNIISETTEDLGAEAKNEWVKNAESSLKNPDSYVQAVQDGTIYPADGNALKYVIDPPFKKSRGDKNIGELVENGFEPFDMKQGLLKGADKKIIPIGINSNDLPEEKEDKIKLSGERKLKYFSVLSPKQSRFPLRNYSFNSYRFNQNSKSAARVVTIKYRWKTNSLKGLKRIGNRHTVFRTVSKNSDPNSWIHPGMLPKKILEKTVNIILPRIKPAYEEAIKKTLQ